MIRFMNYLPFNIPHIDPHSNDFVSMRFIDWRKFRTANGLNQYSRREYGSLLIVKLRKVDPWK